MGWGYWKASSRWGLSVPLVAGHRAGWFSWNVAFQLLPTAIKMMPILCKAALDPSRGGLSGSKMLGANPRQTAQAMRNPRVVSHHFLTERGWGSHFPFCA